MANIQSGYLKTKNGTQLMTTDNPIIHYLRFNQFSNSNYPSYYLIAKLPPTSASNGFTIRIQLTTGGYGSTAKMHCDITISNREGIYVFGTYYGYDFFSGSRLVVYKQSNGEHWIYLHRITQYVGETYLMTECESSRYVGSNTPTTPSGTLEKTVDSSVLFRNDKNMLSLIFPVGAVYITANNNNPQTFLGGTWVAFGQGRTLMGVNTSDTDFNTPLKTGGNKTHYHNYGIQYNAFYSSLYADDSWLIRTYNGLTGGWEGTPGSGSSSTNTGNNGVEERRGSNFSSSVMQKVQNTSATNSVPPYITVYFWRRTA